MKRRQTLTVRCSSPCIRHLQERLKTGGRFSYVRLEKGNQSQNATRTPSRVLTSFVIVVLKDGRNSTNCGGEYGGKAMLLFKVGTHSPTRTEEGCGM